MVIGSEGSRVVQSVQLVIRSRLCHPLRCDTDVRDFGRFAAAVRVIRRERARLTKLPPLFIDCPPGADIDDERNYYGQPTNVSTRKDTAGTLCNLPNRSVERRNAQYFPLIRDPAPKRRIPI